MRRYEIWYMRPEHFAAGIMGGGTVDPAKLDATHIHLTSIDADGLDAAFYEMQAEQWSPNGEARDLIRAKGLEHTSMSVGDAIAWVDEEGQHVALVANVGFRELLR